MWSYEDAGHSSVLAAAGGGYSLTSRRIRSRSASVPTPANGEFWRIACISSLSSGCLWLSGANSVLANQSKLPAS
jgi:hypothetical protein